MSWTLIHLGIFLEAFILSLLLTPLVAGLGKKWKLVDLPGERKIHDQPKARSGGVAIFLSFMVVLVFNLVVALYFSSYLPAAEGVTRFLPNILPVLPKLALIITGALIIFITGLLDDRFGLSPYSKLLGQGLAAVCVLLAGIKIVLFLPPAAGMLLTFVWLVLLMNSFNFLDNMDGLCAGVAVVVLLMMGLVSWRSAELFNLALIAVAGGAILGFLPYNFHPSRLFMGDSGSLFIGYLVGVFSVMLTYYGYNVPTRLPVLTPLLILGVPLFDTISVLLIRWHRGAPLMRGDTNHFSHRLVKIGMSVSQAVVFIYLLTICIGMNALALNYLPLGAALIHTSQAIILFVLIFLLEKAGRERT